MPRKKGTAIRSAPTAPEAAKPTAAPAIAALKEAWIRFMAPVNSQTATALLSVIDQKLAQGVGRLHLMISSPGGTVFHGLSIFNFLRGAPIEVFTYNFGSVDSIGVVIFCAGSQRFSVPHARFLIHGVSFNIQGTMSFDEKALEERLKSLKIDYQNIARVIADNTARKHAEVMADMDNRTTLNPLEAKKYGLVHKIASKLFPLGADLAVIAEGPPAQPPIQFAVPSGPPVSFIQHVTAPVLESYTHSIAMDHGTQFTNIDG